MEYKQQKNLILIKQKLDYKMSSDQEIQNFDRVEAGALDCTPIQGGSIKKGAYCILKGNPCKVLETAISKPGKHGSAKIVVTGVDLFTNKKIEGIFATSGQAWAPNVTKTQYQVTDIDEDGFVSLLCEDNSLKEDMKLPEDEEVRDMLQKCWRQNNEKFQVFFNVLSACGKSKFVSCRTKQN